MDDRTYTATELATKLRVHPDTLRTWRRRQTGPPYYKVGGAIRYPKLEAEAWLQAQKVETSAKV